MERTAWTGMEEGIGRREVELAPGRSEEGSPLTFDPRRIALGAKGGLISTVAMTTFRMPIANSLPE